jgi:hypothetical protein
LAPEYNGEYISGTTIYREGESRWQYYMPRYAGVDPHTGLALYYAKTQPAADATEEEIAKFVPEEYVTSDYNVAQATGREATGDIAPDVYGGFGTSLEFYGFDLSVQFSYQLGGMLYDEFTLTSLGRDRTPVDYFYADEINQLEKNLKTVSNHTLKMSYGNAPLFVDNGNTMTFADLNRLEGAILDLYNRMTNEFNGRRMFKWNFGMKGGDL